jgi:hypothetical protein
MSEVPMYGVEGALHTKERWVSDFRCWFRRFVGSFCRPTLPFPRETPTTNGYKLKHAIVKCVRHGF